jgi:peroxiredoxin
MKRFQLNKIVLKYILAIFLIFAFSFIYAQSNDSILMKLPDVTVKTLGNNTIYTSEITNNGKPIILIFWKSCCSPNIKMLDEINEVYSDWQKETGVVLYAVSIDDSKSSSKILPLANGKSWEFNVLLDLNSDFKRAMNVIATPHVFILNGKNEVIWQKTTYIQGEVDEIYNILETL